MPRSPQAFSAPSKQMPGLNPKGDLNSIVSISASSTISTPSSEPSASKPRDNNPKREQNSRYRHNNGLNGRNRKRPISIGDPVSSDRGYWVARSSRAMTRVGSALSGAHRIEELADLDLEAVAFVRQRLSRG